DRDLMFVVEEVRPGGDSRDELLGVARQVETAPGEVIEPLAFEVAPRLLLQGFEMLREGGCGGGSQDRAAGESEECFLDRVAVEQLMLALVCVRHQAIVTGNLA